jgi:hypothetical protein
MPAMLNAPIAARLNRRPPTMAAHNSKIKLLSRRETAVPHLRE